MLTITAIPLTCWLCALVAIPRKPLPGDEIQELVYRRLIGRQQLLVACAIVTTGAAGLVLLVTAITSSLPEVLS